MKQYSYAELIARCEHNPALADLLEPVIDTALAVVLSAVRGSDQDDGLQTLAIAVEQLNSHLSATKGHGCFVDPELVRDHTAFAQWAGELVFEIYRHRRK